ncbi:MAG: phosphotransferase [Alphaproteobacteria bacterium]
MHIEFLEMIVWAFPNDRTLDRLAVFDDSARLTDEILPEVVASRWGSDYRIATCDRSVANYVPHGRYCFRVDLRLAHGPTGRVRPWSIYGKGRKGDKAEVLHRTLCRLWNSESRIRGEIVIPRPLGYQPEYGLFWQEALDGRTLVLDADDASMFGRAGAAIARLHRTPVACDRRIRVADVTALLRANVGLLGQVRPATRVTLSAVHDRLAQRAPHLDHETVATLHDDLHPENMLVDGERIALIDLDGVSLGPPAYELGCFVARVLHRALLEGKAPTAVHPIIQRFLKGYRAHADWPMPAADIVWYTAAALVNERAFRSVKGLKSTFLETLDDLLGLAQIISNGGDQALAVTLGSNA